MRNIIYGILFLIFFRQTICSPGDQLGEFQRCVEACEQKTCSINTGQDSNNEFLALKFMEMPLSLPLKAFLWDCSLNCDYQCQDIINIIRKQNDLELYQFHGKWFFIRYFNIQEPASSIFSLFNLISHYIGLQVLNGEIIKLRKLNLINNLKAVNKLIWLLENYKIACKIAMGAWICSTIFHLRDLDATEKMDYFFAGATVLSGLYCATIRLFKLYDDIKKVYILRAVLIFVYVCHVTRLLIDWNYTYNMQINLLWAVIQYFQWGWVSVAGYMKYSKYLNKKDFKKRQALKQRDLSAWRLIYLKYQPNRENVKCLSPTGLSIWVSLGLVFEVFDFPPWKDLIDAHSLWHLVTIVPGYLWYHWMVWDTAQLKDLIL